MSRETRHWPLSPARRLLVFSLTAATIACGGRRSSDVAEFDPHPVVAPATSGSERALDSGRPTPPPDVPNDSSTALRDPSDQAVGLPKAPDAESAGRPRAQNPAELSGAHEPRNSEPRSREHRNSEPGNSGISFASVGLKEALQKASAEKKHVMVDVYTNWCGWCKKLDREVFSNARVGDAARTSVVAIKLNAEEEGQDFVIRHRVGGLPTILFLDSGGNVVDKVVGYVGVDEMVQVLSRLPKSSA